MSEKVLITGLNIISSLGLTLEENWENLLKGKSGIKKINLFDASGLDTQIAGQVDESFDEYSTGFIKKRLAMQMTRVSKFCLTAVKVAIQEHNIPVTEFDPERCAVIFGVVNTANSSVEKGTTNTNTIVKGMNNALSAWISLEYGFEGPNYTIATACSSSAYAIANGYDLIKQKKADLVIVGGADSAINPEDINGFNSLYALSTNNDNPEQASCPFSADRDGFIIGEGAGVLILESETSAKNRNAKVYAEIAGYGLTNEAFNIMSPRTNGEGMAKTMQKAIKDSGIEISEIDYINAHGTSTTLNDLYETLAIEKVLGVNAKNVAVSSSKSMIGHTIGAAGAIEAAITAKSIFHGLAHPTINLNKPDPSLQLDYIPNVKRSIAIRCALSNSFAFGGHNSTLVFRKY